MSKVISKDGTTIAFNSSGQGEPIILVDGALCSRSFGPMPKLTRLLSANFAVITYDRRGRGESGDATSYAVEREVEDMDALIAAAGGLHLCSAPLPERCLLWLQQQTDST
jgi:pimeloyl-ACP methyl ester carboxylesterase